MPTPAVRLAALSRARMVSVKKRKAGCRSKTPVRGKVETSVGFFHRVLESCAYVMGAQTEKGDKR